MRKFSKSRIAQVMLLGLGVALTGFGIDKFGFGGQGLQGGVLSRIGGREVKVTAVDFDVKRLLDQMRLEQGVTKSASDLARSGEVQGIIQDQEIRNTLLAYADKVGIQASPDALRPYLEQRKLLVDEFGQLSRQQLLMQAQERGQTPKEFEDYIRDFITQDYIRSSASAAMHVPDVLSQPWISYLGESRTLSLAQVTAATAPTPADPTDAEMQNWYTAHILNFKQPERRRISVLTYSPDDFLDKVPLTDEQVKAEYAKRIADYSTPETREIAEFESTDRNAVQAFVDLTAQGIAVDEALKQSPGVTRKDMTTKLADMKDEKYGKFLFALAPGKVNNFAYQQTDNSSEPWKTALVVKATPGVPTPFDEVADKVRRDAAWEDAVGLFDKSSEQFLSDAGGQPLEDLAKQYGFPLISLGPIDQQARTIYGDQAQIMVKNPDMLQQLFTLRAGDMTNVVEGDNVRSMFRLDEVIPPYTLPFDEVKPRVKLAIMNERATEARDKAAAAMVAAVKAGTAFDKAAAENKLNALPQSLTQMRASNSPVDPAVMEAAFALKAGEVAVVHSQNLTPWVVRIDKIEPATPQIAQMLRQQLGGQIDQSLIQDLNEVFVRGLTAEVEYKRDDAAIQTYLKRLVGDTPQQ